MQIFNTLTRQKEEFVPQVPGEYRIYVCGPTVYNYIHIGNARPVVVFDVLRRLLEHSFPEREVIFARNITDVDDKINAAAKDQGVPISTISFGTPYGYVEINDQRQPVPVDDQTLKKVADDIQARKDELGVDGAFTSAGMDGSSDWRFKTHLANLPIYYEYKADGIGSTDAIKGTYLDNYKQIWDLYITDSTCDPTLLASKTGNDAVAEFVGKKAVFYQNGTWAYNDVKDLGDDNLGMLPIYIGVDGEENQGLCTGSENFWCVNNTASEADIQATLDFLYWCVTSETGTSAMADKMGFVIPFKKAKDSTNPLIAIANDYVASGKTSVDWCFSTMPSEEWKNGVGSALTAYAAGTGSWDDVVTAFVDGWAKEYKLANG